MLKKILSLLLILMLLPVASLGEEDADPAPTEIVEDVLLDDEPVLEEDGAEEEEDPEDDESGEDDIYIPEDLDIPEEDQAALEALEAEADIDDSVDPSTLELNPNLPDNVINILLVGVDAHTADPKEIVGLGDSQIIVSVDRDAGTIKMTSILRDSYVTIPTYKNKYKINCSFQYGCNKKDADGHPLGTTGGARLAMRTINHNFEMNIQYCVAINFNGLASIIESLGGLEIDMTKKEARAVNRYLAKAYKSKKFNYDNKDRKDRVKLEETAGVHLCDGIQALTYARLRSIDNDFARTNRQRHLLNLLLEKVLHGMDLNKMMDLLETCTNYAYTNMNIEAFYKLGMAVLGSGIMNRIGTGETLFEQMRIPMDKSYSYDTVNGASVVKYNITKHTKALHEFIYGEYIPAD